MPISKRTLGSLGVFAFLVPLPMTGCSTPGNGGEFMPSNLQEQSDPVLGTDTRFGKDERFNVQFRWEAFNFWNRANFNQPAVVVNVASPRFGSITSAGRAREMQFGLKLEF